MGSARSDGGHFIFIAKNIHDPSTDPSKRAKTETEKTL